MRGWTVMVGAALLAACGGGETTVLKTDEGEVRRSADGETLKLEGRDGASATVVTGGAALDPMASELSTKLPAFAPLYPGAKVVSTMAGTGGSDGGSGMVLVMETADSLSDVVGFYDERIKAAGVTSQMTATTADSATRMVADEANRTGTMISVSDSGDTRTVTLTSSHGG